MITILRYTVGEGRTEGGAPKQKPEVGQGRGRLVLQKNHSEQKEERVENTEMGTCSRNRKGVTVPDGSEGGSEQG